MPHTLDSHPVLQRYARAIRLVTGEPPRPRKVQLLHPAPEIAPGANKTTRTGRALTRNQVKRLSGYRCDIRNLEFKLRSALPFETRKIQERIERLTRKACQLEEVDRANKLTQQ